jgi:RND family efflux transporter MFP subunit
MRRLRRVGIIASGIAVALAVVGIVSRMSGESELAARTAEEAIPTVAIITPQHGLADQELVLPGDIQAYFEAPIYARVSGYLKSWSLDIGARVKAGELLAEIDTPDLDQQLRQAQADLAAAQAKLGLADLTSKRWHALLKTDSVSQQETDERAGDAEAKKADVNAEQANVDRLMALEAFKRIVAPFDGIVTARETDVGALINAGSGTGPELFKVADVHKMRIYVGVPQAMSGGIAPGDSAELRLPQRPNAGVNAIVVTSAHAINQASRTLLVELQADNPDGTLQPGTYAEVHFQLAADPDALKLPASAVLFRRNGLEVATLGTGDKVVLKPVTVTRDLGAELIIGSGLDAADRVIDSPPDSLAAGDLVRPLGPVKPADAR